MKPTQIQIEGLKARDRVIDLTGRDAITGDVRSGKSTVRDAIMFLATGQYPAAGKSIADAARLMRGPQMRVRMTWDDGSWAERTLRRKGKGYTMDASTSWTSEGANASDAKAAILERFGASDVEAVQNLDLERFAHLTGPQQADAVNALLDASGQDPQTLSARLSAMTALRIVEGGDVDLIDTNRATLRQIEDGALARLSETHRRAHHAALVKAESWTDTGNLADAITWAREQKADKQARALDKSKARREIEDRDAAIDAPAKTLDQLNAERQAQTDLIATLQSEVSAYNRATEAREAAEKALAEAQEALDKVVGDTNPEEVAQGKRDLAAKLRAEAAEIKDPPAIRRQKHVTASPDVLALVDRMEAEAVDLEAQAAEADPDFSVDLRTVPALPSMEPAEAAVLLAEQKLKAAESDPWTEARSHAEKLRSYVESAPEAEGVKRHGLVVRIADSLLRLADDNGADIPALTQSLADAQAALGAAQALRSQVEAQAAQIEQANDAARQAAQAASQRARDLRGQAKAKRDEASRMRGEEMNRVSRENAAIDKANRDAEVERAVLLDEALRIRRAKGEWADSHESEAADLLREWETAKHAVETAEAKLSGMSEVQPLDVQDHETRILTARQEIARIDEAKRAVEGADARKRELFALLAEIEAAEAEAEVARAFAWALPKIRDEDLAARRGPILDRMTAFLQAAGMTERPFLEAEKGKVSYGWVTGRDHPDLPAGERIDGLALSGAEGIIFRAALWSAIVGLRNPKTQILALEIDDCRPEWAARLFAGIESLDGMSAIVCTNRASIEIPEGWAVHEMSASVAQKAGAA